MFSFPGAVTCSSTNHYWRNEDVMFIHCYGGCGDFTFGIKRKKLLEGDKSCEACDSRHCLGAYQGYNCIWDCPSEYDSD